MKKSIYFLFCVLAALFSQCKKTDLSASYIEISSNPFVMDVRDYPLQHDDFSADPENLYCIKSQKFPDVWLFVNGKDMGTWEIPCKIPVLAKGKTKVQIYPGVKMNGVSTSRPRYPFVETNTMNLDLRTAETTTVDSVSIKYYTTSSFKIIEHFQGNSNRYFRSLDSVGPTFRMVSDADFPLDPSYTQNQVGCISLANDTTFEVVSDKSFLRFSVVPQYAFLELDYRCDVEAAQFVVSMLVDKYVNSVSSTVMEPLVVVNASPTWKKMYINLTQSIARNVTNVINYRLDISGSRTDDNIPMNFYFDNIKVIYR